MLIVVLAGFGVFIWASCRLANHWFPMKAVDSKKGDVRGDDP